MEIKGYISSSYLTPAPSLIATCNAKCFSSVYIPHLVHMNMYNVYIHYICVRVAMLHIYLFKVERLAKTYCTVVEADRY